MLYIYICIFNTHTHICIHIYIHRERAFYVNIYIYIYIYTNLPLNAIVRLPHPWSGDSQGQETILAPSTDKQTRNHDTES